MKSWALCLVALGLVCWGVGLGEAHIMTPDFVRQANKESITTHEKELDRENELRQAKEHHRQLRIKKKELEENERLEKKSMQNMSDDKLKELKREKREAEKRSEMKTVQELKRLEKKNFKLKSESSFSTELKSAKKKDKKSHLLKKQLEEGMSLKQLLEKDIKQLESVKASKASKVKHLKKSASVKDEKKKLAKSLSGKITKKRSTDETILKHAPEYMKLGRNVEEKRALKKLRMRIKREAEWQPYDATDTKAFLSMRPAGKHSKHSEEDQDYWNDEHTYMKKDAGESPAPMAWRPDDDYNEVEGGDYLLEEGAAEETAPVTSGPGSNEDVEEEESFPVEEVFSETVPAAASDVAANEVIPVTEADLPDYIPTSSAALVGEVFTQTTVLVTPGLPSTTPDTAANEIIPVTEADQPELIQTSSYAPVEEAATQPPILVPTILPNPEVPTTGLPSVNVISFETSVSESLTSPPIPTTSQSPVVSTVKLEEPNSSGSDTESPSEELVALSSSSGEPSLSYEEPDNLGDPDLTIVTLAPELPFASSAPLLARFGSAPSTIPAVVSETTLQESSETTTLPPTTTQFSGPWPWQNLGPGEESQCGQARFGPESRVDRGQRRTLKILDGKEALPGSFPWQVAILDKDRDMLCGGSLIAPRWVMTAAHCIRKKLFVRLSEHHIRDKDGYEVEQKVRRVFRHPDFNSTTIDNDIALLRLPSLPPFPDSLSGVARVGVTDRACLPADQEDFPSVGTRCLVMGWGKASSTNSYGTDVLMYTRLPIISRKACIRANRKTITENMFCAGHYKGGSDTCSGDSGGPLLCSSGGEPSEETWTVYGVTSFGDGCGNAGKMGVYAKVNNYLGWIAGIMKKY